MQTLTENILNVTLLEPRLKHPTIFKYFDELADEVVDYKKQEFEQVLKDYDAVLGTVKGDLHDIGKGLVGVLLAAHGFEVHDLGHDVPVERFLAAMWTFIAPASQTRFSGARRFRRVSRANCE